MIVPCSLSYYIYTYHPPQGKPSHRPFINAIPSTGDWLNPSITDGSNISDAKSWNESMSSTLKFMVSAEPLAEREVSVTAFKLEAASDRLST